MDRDVNFNISSPNFIDLLMDNNDLILRSLVVSGTLLLRLKRIDYIRDAVQKVKQLTSNEERSCELLDVLSDVHESHVSDVFRKFISALRCDGQEHVANIFCQDAPLSDARPMSDEHYQLLVSRRGYVCSFLDPLNGILDELVDVGVLSEADYKEVLTLRDSQLDNIARRVIDILSCKADSAFDLFITALQHNGQEHIATILRPGDEIGTASLGVPMTEEHRSLLTTKQDQLLQFLDPVIILPKLVSQLVLTKRDEERIRAKPTYPEMSQELINFIQRKSDNAFHQLIESLKCTEQRHVVHIITGEGDPPISEGRLKILQIKRMMLMEKLECRFSLLTDKLFQNGCFTKFDNDRVMTMSSNKEQIRILLEIISRKSETAFDKFLLAMKDPAIGQEHIAKEIEGLELPMILTPSFQNGADRKSIVHLVRNDIRMQLCCKEPDVSSLINLMNDNGFTVSNVTEGSIRITFRCYNEQSLANLRRLYTDKTLDNEFTRAFCPSYAEHGLVSLSLSVNEKEFDKCAQKFVELSLMTSEHTRALLRAVETMGERIQVTEELVNILPILQHQRDAILKTVGHDEQVRTLFEIVSRRPDTAFTQLIDALTQTHQHTVAQFLIDNYTTGKTTDVGDMQAEDKQAVRNTQREREETVVLNEKAELIKAVEELREKLNCEKKAAENARKENMKGKQITQSKLEALELVVYYERMRCMQMRKQVTVLCRKLKGEGLQRRKLKEAQMKQSTQPSQYDDSQLNIEALRQTETEIHADASAFSGQYKDIQMVPRWILLLEKSAHHDAITRSLVLSDMLLKKLSDIEFVCDTVPDIRQLATSNDKNRRLIQRLRLVPEDQSTSIFNAFLEALRSEGQEHVASILIPESTVRPMSDEHYMLLRIRRNQLSEFLDPLNGVIDELVSSGVFTGNDWSRIRAIRGLNQMARETIDILSRKADSAFDLFITALHNNGQQHVAALLRPDTSNILMTDEHTQLLKNKKSELCRFLDPLTGVLNELVSSGVFSDRENLDVRREWGICGKLDKTIEILSRKADSAFDFFISALNNTGHEHVAALLVQNTSRSPMSVEHRQLLVDKKRELSMFLDPLNGVLDDLVSSGVFSASDSRRVRERRRTDKMAAKTIGILSRKTNDAFDIFITSLQNNDQKHVAAIVCADIPISQMTEAHRSMLRGELQRFLDPLNGIIDELVTLNVFTNQDSCQVRRRHGINEMASEIIEILIRKADSAFDLFITALNKTDQQHVAYILTGEGEPPLSATRMAVIEREREYLATHIDIESSNSLIETLESNNVITPVDKQLIAAETSNYRMNGVLLDVIVRKSRSSYDRFLQALKDVKQANVVQHIEFCEQIHEQPRKPMLPISNPKLSKPTHHRHIPACPMSEGRIRKKNRHQSIGLELKLTIACDEKEASSTELALPQNKSPTTSSDIQLACEEIETFVSSGEQELPSSKSAFTVTKSEPKCRKEKTHASCKEQDLSSKKSTSAMSKNEQRDKSNKRDIHETGTKHKLSKTRKTRWWNSLIGRRRGGRRADQEFQ